MASQAHTTRRRLFAITGGIAAAVALPAAAQAAPHDEWEIFVAGVSLMHPRLAEQARAAQAAGYKVSECYSVIAVGDAPCLCFSRDYGPGSEELTNFQHGRPN